jgi:hypothetical protein
LVIIPERERHFGSTRLCERIILNWMLEKRNGAVDWICLSYDRDQLWNTPCLLYSGFFTGYKATGE